MRKNERAFAKPAGKLKAMAHPARLRLLMELIEGECCVSRIQSCLSLSQPHVSQSLKVLRTAGVIAGRRDKTRICYRIVDPQVLQILQILKPRERPR